MNTGRVAWFLTIILSLWAAAHLYVFWRLTSVPWVAAHVSRRALVWTGFALWASYPVVRVLEWRGLEVVVWPLEFAAAIWIGFLFLLVVTLLITDVVTLGGWPIPRLAPTMRGWAVLAAGGLSCLGLVQGLRPPVVRDYEVPLAGLPPAREGLLVVVISDLHLGTLLGRRWMARVVGRVQEMRPDLVVVLGDLIDANPGDLETLLPVLKNLRAPLGVWAVTGNHEYYAGLERSVRLFEQAGYALLRDRWVEVAPGLVLAGVDDLSARRQFRLEGQPVEKALANRPAGVATILLSHSPWQADRAAAAGVGLMLSGHTHNGQLWPFNYLVRLTYPLLGGRGEVGGMPVIVCRGTGTWGPRMRLWRPGEILRIRLRAATPGPRTPSER